AERGIRLEIQTADVKLTLEQDTLSRMQADNKELFFRIVPIRGALEQEQAKQRVEQAEALTRLAGDGIVQALGLPMTIETNYENRDTKIELPLNGLTVPKDPADLAAFAADLAV